MDIDVKIALDQVLRICESLESRGMRAKEMVARDTLSFIRAISKEGAEARFDFFSNLYLNGGYSATQFSETEKTDIPIALELFCKVDALSEGSGNWTAKTLISFFTILGKSYMSSAFDRKQIDVLQIAEQIKQMNAYVGEMAVPKPAQKNISTETEQQRIVQSIEKAETAVEPEPEPVKSLDELLDELRSLTGLAAVKKEVNQIVNLIRVQKKGEEFGVVLPPLSLHLVFFGNPGTGKTTVARLLSQIYHSLGVLTTGQLIEVDRGKLVAGYVGQTAIKTQEAIDQAMGGILFIDEAYTLTHGKGENDFGQEAVDTILKAMEDHRDDFIVIVAGYPDLMKEFIASNPGLKSRFNQFINFEDYTAEELLAIFKGMCEKQRLVLSEFCGEFLRGYFEELYEKRSSDYANARDVRNYFEKVIKARANRLADNLSSISFEEYMTILLEDLQEAAKNNTTF